MYKLVLLRHGESSWNKENRFTGWKDVDLSERGMAEARRAGHLPRAEGFVPDEICKAQEWVAQQGKVKEVSTSG